MNPTLNDGPSAPVDRFCDLVMKGGITSGVVYPPAICALAKNYRFKNIGGTSAGAIAAAVTAAAEYRRRCDSSMDGFTALEALPDELGTKGSGGKTQLFRLFQPDRPCLRLFRILTGSLNKGGTIRRVVAILSSCIGSYWIASLASVLGSGVIGYFHSILAGILFLLISLPSFVGLSIYFDVTRNVVSNNYGLCKGMTTTSKDGPALTPWLHALIQRSAGRTTNEPPLTFGDLWRAPGFPPASLAMSEAERRGVRSIDLQMFTTNLTHGRPYIFPHVEPTARLFFNPDELKGYLPGEVLAWLDKYALPYTAERRTAASDPPVEDAVRLNLKEIPEPENFPILLAARMSLSFPFLFAAVPLWAVDYEDARGHRTFRRCVFSDGGISSNFPMHLFDGLVPLWPTFGIELEAELPGLPNNLLFLPHSYGQGIADHWTRFDQQERAASRLGGFLMSIVGVMQNWNDNVLSRMPGVRDRVVRLRLKDKEGGMNLNMPSDLIRVISERGRKAADLILGRFLGQPHTAGAEAHSEPTSPADEVLGTVESAKSWPGWDFQRWVRLDVLLRTFADKAEGLSLALGPRIPHGTSYADMWQRSQAEPPPGHGAPLTRGEADALRDLMAALDRTAKTFADRSPLYPNTPVPTPELRVRPSL
jgi:predicted acylesterase/phospholipase RssA